MDWTRLALSRPRTVVLAVLFATAPLGAVALRGLAIDNTIPAWLPPGDPDLARYEEFRAVFGEDDFAVVAVDGVALDDPARRAEFQRLEESIRALDVVSRVEGPWGAGGEPRLASADVRTALLLVHPVRPEGFHERLLEAIAGSPLAGRTLVAGPEAIAHDLDAGSRESFGRLFPVAVILIAAVIWIALRDARAGFAVLAVSASGTVLTLGAMALAGRSLNMVSSSIPALLVVLGTAYSLHLASAFQARCEESPTERWAGAMRETFRPCLLTAATTAAGFLSLATADIPPVQDLGVFGAFGILASFGLVFTLLPALLVLTGTGRRPPRLDVGERWLCAMEWVRRRRWAIHTLSLAIAVASAIGISRLKVESHILAFFPERHPLVEATHRIEERVVGLTPVEIWFHGPLDRMASPEMVAAARALEEACLAEPGVTAVFGPLASEERLAGVSPDRAARIVRFALAAPGASRASPDRLRVGGDDVDVRWTVAVRTLSQEESHALVGRIRDQVARRAPEGVAASVTGSIPILVRIQTLLLRTQIETFALSMALVTALLVLAFRSLRLALLSLVPNLLPIAMTLGAMGYAGIPLDVATVTVASIALGLVVDDTIHILDRFARNRSPGRTAVERLDAVFRSAGRPIVFTSLATAAGFSAFAVAPFRPTLYFGLLISATAIFALACDLFLTPALLLGGRAD